MIIEVTVPSPGESVAEVTIQSWLKNDGEIVARDEALAEIESDKATLTVYSEQAGQLKILVPAGQTIPVGVKICTLDTSITAGATPVAVQTVAVKQETIQTASVSTTTKESYAKNLPSVSAQKLMDEKGISADQINGGGLGGRITKTDVVNFTPTKTSQAETPKVTSDSKSSTPVHSLERVAKRTQMSKLRKTLGNRLVAVKNETAMLTTFNEVDMTAILELRKKYKEKFNDTHKVGLGFMGFFTKACSEALKQFPAVNSQIDGDEVVSFNYVDMGIAVSSDRGLVVPVVRNADKLSLAEIEKEILSLATRARENKITIDDMMGGTFTITNGGVFGSLMSTPILNPPQSAILGMHKTEERPIALNGQVVIRPMMYLALSYDHRVIDGKESVSFLVKVKEYLEDPTRLILGV